MVQPAWVVVQYLAPSSAWPVHVRLATQSVSTRQGVKQMPKPLVGWHSVLAIVQS